MISSVPRPIPLTNVHDIKCEINLMRDKRAPISHDEGDDFVTPLKRLIESEKAIMTNMNERQRVPRSNIEVIELKTTPQQKVNLNEGQ